MLIFPSLYSAFVLLPPSIFLSSFISLSLYLISYLYLALFTELVSWSLFLHAANSPTSISFLVLKYCCHHQLSRLLLSLSLYLISYLFLHYSLSLFHGVSSFVPLILLPLFLSLSSSCHHYHCINHSPSFSFPHPRTRITTTSSSLLPLPLLSPSTFSPAVFVSVFLAHLVTFLFAPVSLLPLSSSYFILPLPPASLPVTFPSPFLLIYPLFFLLLASLSPLSSSP